MSGVREGVAASWHRPVGLAAALLLSMAPIAVPGVAGSGAQVLATLATQNDASATLTVGGLQRHYRLFVPTVPAARAGLLVMLHGVGGSGGGFEATTGLDGPADRAGEYVAYPDGIGHSWNARVCCAPAATQGVDDGAFLDALIAQVRGSYPIDATRILVGGFSNGGLMAFRYACLHRQPVQYIVGNAALAVTGDCTQSTPVHALAINGLADTTVYWAKPNNSSLYLSPQPSAAKEIGQFAAVNGCGPNYTETTDSTTGNQHYVSDCRSGASIDQYAVPKLDHRWAVGPQAVATYGVNSTSALCSWVAAQWGRS